MKGDYGAVYPLWSHDDQPGGLLDRLAGEVGVSHMTIPVITGPATVFRPRPAHGPHLFHTEGGWHYPPAAEGYSASAVRARSAGWFGKRNVLRAVCEAAGARGVRVDVRLDLRAVRALYEHEPHLRMRNAWGDEIPGALCVNNADLRALCEEVVAELVGYGVGGVQLVDWFVDPPPASLPAPMSFEPTRPWNAAWLLRQCYCPSCRGLGARADVDLEVAVRTTRELVERAWLGEAERSEEPDLLRRMRRARIEDWAAWLARLPARWPELQWMLTGERLTSDERLMAFEPDDLPAEYLPVVTLDSSRLYSGSEDALGESLTLLTEFAEGTVSRRRPPGIAMNLSQVRAPGDLLVRFVHEARGAGTRYFDFSEADVARPDALEWLHQALRFARRDDSPA